MSAENMNAEPSAPSVATTTVDDGPREIFTDGSKAVADVTDVVEKVRTEKVEPEGQDQGETGRNEKTRSKGVQDRIDELTRARREAEREAEYWKARNGGTPANSPAQNAAPLEKPVAANFQTTDEYVEALADWKVDQKLSQRDAQTKQAEAVGEKVKSWQTKLVEARQAIPDFDEVVNATEAPVASHVAELMFEHDAGGKLMHHFAKNPEALEELNGMSPTKAAFKIAEIASKLAPATTAPPPAVKPSRTISSAPPPARSIGQGRSTNPSLGEMDMDSYMATRKSQGASWAR